MIGLATFVLLALKPSSDAEVLKASGFRSAVRAGLPLNTSANALIVSDDGNAAFIVNDNQQDVLLVKSGKRLGAVNAPGIGLITRQPVNEPALVPRPAVGNGYLHPFVIAAANPFVWFAEDDSYQVGTHGPSMPKMLEAGVGRVQDARSSPLQYQLLRDKLPGRARVGRWAAIGRDRISILRTAKESGGTQLLLCTYDWKRNLAVSRTVATFPESSLSVVDADSSGRVIATVAIGGQSHSLRLLNHGKTSQLPYGCWLWHGRVLATRPDGVCEVRGGKLRKWLPGWDWLGSSANEHWVMVRAKLRKQIYLCRAS